MLTVSSNAAAHAFLRVLGRHAFNQEMDRIGLSQTRVPEDVNDDGTDGDAMAVTSAADMAHLLRLLATPNQLTDASENELTQWLANIAPPGPVARRALPDGVGILDKTGNLQDVSNVGALLESDRGAAILVVLDEGVNPGDARGVIAQFGQAAYAALLAASGLTGRRQTVLAYALDWADLLVRWLHVTAAIAWIGTSFYYIALDYHLLPPRGPAALQAGIGGEVWEIHGGGFYRVEKYRVAPPTLPKPLHWFKWEAYTTWLSGFTLLVVLYYANASTYMIDRSVADMSPLAAVAISVALLVVGWFCVRHAVESARRSRPAARGGPGSRDRGDRVWGEPRVRPAGGLHPGGRDDRHVDGCQRPPGDHSRAAGARRGQRSWSRARSAGLGLRGKQRSIHNNYFTLPVLFAMISNHFPFTYGHPQGWLVLLALMGIGAWIRYFFNLRNQGRVVWAIRRALRSGWWSWLWRLRLAT